MNKKIQESQLMNWILLADLHVWENEWHFMSPFDYHLTIKYPYDLCDILNNFLPTKIKNPPFSAFTVPFNHLSKRGARKLLEENVLPISFELEEEFENETGIKTDWINRIENQKMIIEWFYRHIEPEKSLCFFYAKKVPFVEDQNRIIIGAGRVTQIDPTGNMITMKNENTGV